MWDRTVQKLSNVQSFMVNLIVLIYISFGNLMHFLSTNRILLQPPTFYSYTIDMIIWLLGKKRDKKVKWTWLVVLFSEGSESSIQSDQSHSDRKWKFLKHLDTYGVLFAIREIVLN